MYRIIVYDSPTDKTGHVVFDPRVNRYISDGKLNLKESEIDDLSLTVNQANYLFGNVRPLQTHVEVYQDNKMIFRGRALDLTRMMKDSGQFVQSFVFESIQNYLQDTSQRWAKINNMSIKSFFTKLIEAHNAQVPKYKQFTVRTVDVTNSTDNAYYYIEDGATTWDTIKDKLVSRLGGFIRVEYVDGVNYIDYLQNPGKEHPNDTPIRIGKNLQSASVQIDPTEVITQLVPLGATIENNSTTTDTEVSQPRIDIKSVNGGKDYLDIPDLQAEFGIIRKSVQWDDVHEPKILLTKAKQWVARQTAAKESWTVNALELPQLASFKVSDRYLFNNQAVASPQLLRVTAKTVDLLHWQKSTLTIAEKASSLSNYQLENRNALKSMQQLRSQFKSQSSSIGKLNDQAKQLQDEMKAQNSSAYPWQGKSITAIGDSITYGWIENEDNDYNVTAPWTGQLGPMCKFAKVTNAGVGSSRVAKNDNQTVLSFSERVDGIQGQDFVALLGGINDFLFDNPLGVFMDSSITTFYGALDYIAKSIVKHNPNARVLWMTPMVEAVKNQTMPWTYGRNNDGIMQKNNAGYTQKDYADAIIKVASYYSFAVLDLMNNCVISPLTRDDMFRDGLHPNKDGYKKLGEQIARQINIL